MTDLAVDAEPLFLLLQGLRTRFSKSGGIVMQRIAPPAPAADLLPAHNLSAEAASDLDFSPGYPRATEGASSAAES